MGPEMIEAGPSGCYRAVCKQIFDLPGFCRNAPALYTASSPAARLRLRRKKRLRDIRGRRVRVLMR